jgi:DNA-binding NarL/FixJ family response regulator
VNPRMKVLILSDNRLLRESLGRILSKRADLEVVLSPGGSSDLREEAMRSEAEVLVVDSPRYLSSISCCPKGQNGSGNSLKILLVAMEEDERLFLRSVRAGVLGFIPKEASALDVVAAVRSVARGEAVCPPRLCKFLFDFVAAQTVVFPDSRARLRLGLTRREQQLIPMIGRGLTNKEIASQLNLSEQTIKNHVHRILHKVGVENRLSILGASNSWDLQN